MVLTETVVPIVTPGLRLPLEPFRSMASLVDAPRAQPNSCNSRGRDRALFTLLRIGTKICEKPREIPPWSCRLEHGAT